MTKNPITIFPDGTGECYPVFTCLPKKDVTKIAITDENGTYVYLGSDVDPDSGDSSIDNEPACFMTHVITWLPGQMLRMILLPLPLITG
jgi:hypothetical protein